MEYRVVMPWVGSALRADLGAKVRDKLQVAGGSSGLLVAVGPPAKISGGASGWPNGRSPRSAACSGMPASAIGRISAAAA